jgi:hypothetical protein
MMTEAPLQREAGVHEPADVFIAALSEKNLAAEAALVEAFHRRYRAADSLLILDENSNIDATSALRARGFKIFYLPMPPWRLRMILRRLLR